MLKNLTTLLVYVTDMQRSVVFYRDVLGLPLRMQSPGWSELDLGNGVIVGLHVAMGEPKKPAGGWVPGFVTDDVRSAKESVAAAGATVTLDYHDIPGGVIVEFADPDGNPIQVTQSGITCADLGIAVPQH